MGFPAVSRRSEARFELPASKLVEISRLGEGRKKFTKMVAKIVANLISCQFFAKISKKHQKRPHQQNRGLGRASRGPTLCFCRPFLVLFAYFCKELATN